MYPYIILFNKQISMYTIMAIIGMLICGVLASKLIKKVEKTDNNIITLLLVSLIGVFFGGHLLYGLTKITFIIELFNNLDKINSLSNIKDVFIYIFGGSVFYGGLLGGLFVGSIYIKKKNLNKILYYDICTIIIPLFHFFGRIGCFFVGCCYGIESKYGFTYHRSLIESANNINRIPVQLIESLYNFILFGLIYFIYKKNYIKGKLIYLYLILYSCGRFLLEFLRGDMYRGFLFGFSISQVISLIIIISVLIIFIKERFKK